MNRDPTNNSSSQNDFEFNGHFHLQTHGTAMRKKFVPAYVNIYMVEWEWTVFPKWPKKPMVYRRYLDDIFGIWPHPVEELHHFMNILNCHHETIHLKHEIQMEKISFLDTEVFFRTRDDRWMELCTRCSFRPRTPTPFSTKCLSIPGTHSRAS